MDMPANHTRTVFLSDDVAQRILEIADIGNRGFDRLFHLLRNRLVGQSFFATATVIPYVGLLAADRRRGERGGYDRENRRDFPANR